MNKRLGLTALAVVLALVGTGAVFAYAKSADNRAVAGMKATRVLIVQTAIPAGTSWSRVVKGDYLSEEKVPAKAAPSSALHNLEADVPDGQVATVEIKPGQLVVRAMFGEKAPATGVLTIPDRMQAITIELEADAVVGGFVRNGSEVAVYGSFELLRAPGADEKMITGPKAWGSKLVLARVSVIAVNQSPPHNVSGAKDEEGSGTLSRSSSDQKVLVTLSVDQAGAERIVLAQAAGDLYLTLLTNSSVTKDSLGQFNVGNYKPTPLFGK
jgi:pilus assembly protein CpaB